MIPLVGVVTTLSVIGLFFGITPSTCFLGRIQNIQALIHLLDKKEQSILCCNACIGISITIYFDIVIDFVCHL